jgi:hypothetical protein
MNLDESQKQRVVEWIGQGLKLAEIQTRLGSELGVTMTYMEVRMLVDDLKLTPKDVEAPKAVSSVIQSPGAAPAAAAQAPLAPTGKEGTPPGPPGGVAISVDQIARPGTVVSGKVTFSDGNRADWHFDQTGRLGLAPQQTGYRPTTADLQQFQAALEGELSRLGF